MELASPITVYWDLPSLSTDTDFLLRTAADIIDCRPLMLQLTSTAPRLEDGVLAVLERFRGGAIAVSLTIPLCSFDDSVRSLAAHGVVRELLLAAERVEDFSARQEEMGSGVGISFPVSHGNWRELPDLLVLCWSRGIGRLVLPMQRLFGGEASFFLTMKEQRELTVALEAAGGTGGLTLTIHDPFLWRAFNPGVPFPQGGCQAANTMLAIAPDGGVYPCPTLPVRLGTVGSASLKEIIASSAKKELRHRLLERPAACGGCGDLSECRGGCRGRAYVMHDSLEAEDPACW